jgi:deazaflavin-dependent oxidoreductase (nitroreductase family)
MLRLEHTGRTSGVRRRTVLEVVDMIGDSPIVVSGWGNRSDWCRNIAADPHVRVIHCRRRFDAIARRLDRSEALEVFESYRTRHPKAAAAIGRFIGVSWTDDLNLAVDRLPAFRLERED